MHGKLAEAWLEIDVERFRKQLLDEVILEGEKVVVALVNITFTVKKTGKKVVEEDEVHVWRFNDAGKIVRFRHCVDTHQHVLAYRGEIGRNLLNPDSDVQPYENYSLSRTFEPII